MKILITLSISLAVLGCSGGGSSQNQPPVLDAIADVTISANMASDPIAIGFSDRAAANAQVTAASGDEAIVANDALVLAGEGGARTLTVTPVADALGTVAITVVVTDAGGLSAQSSFMVNIAPQQVSFQSEFRRIFAVPANAMPVDLNSRQFNGDAQGVDFADLLN